MASLSACVLFSWVCKDTIGQYSEIHYMRNTDLVTSSLFDHEERESSRIRHARQRNGLQPSNVGIRISLARLAREQVPEVDKPLVHPCLYREEIEVQKRSVRIRPWIQPVQQSSELERGTVASPALQIPGSQLSDRSRDVAGLHT